jgi:hypothetical protein
MAIAWRSKWLDWQPGNQIVNEVTESVSPELTKPAFVSSVSAIPSNIQIISMPADEPDAWREPFHIWMMTACVRRHRGSGGIGCLHVRFAEWCAAGNQVCPPMRLTFVRLLTDAGFSFSDGLVNGLLLREDLEAATMLRARKTAIGSAPRI